MRTVSCGIVRNLTPVVPVGMLVGRSGGEGNVGGLKWISIHKMGN